MLYNDLKEGIYILHENEEWLIPLKEAFKRAGVEFGEIPLTQGSIDLNKKPPKGVFFSRFSASSHTRDHFFAKEYARAILSWLKHHNARVINPLHVLELEVSKVAQYLALEKFGFKTPKTQAVFGKEDLLEVAKNFQTPFITKHNQGGKGLGVRRFESLKDFKTYIHSSEFEPAVDGITLIQEYIQSKDFSITRLEFIGSSFHYALRVDTSGGSFKLCPAQSCELENQQQLPEFANAACELGSNEKFSLRKDIYANTPLIKELEAFLKLHSIEVAGVEFIETPQDECVIYDINTNTNYNEKIEQNLRQKGEKGALDTLVQFLHNELKKELQ
ncbi:alpha-L-glutamate ligase [Campylobacter sp. MIT 12-8780]|uniref:ATP-grasp domain-containing protein n=1 Tax=unclassified Campylobacter TaxID=2593542 RepID=UPI00115F2D8B|nr:MULTISPECIES: alpha-L-glutamate ligase [unclassified Campylobacter]NDJ27723.1 alpha-L-glutamate ligase [Campylobacter sp. MIT 19-121]TQR41069.1 alpha-L-glutamate ligase [Campylobacter sp. MIT 12-8780]